MGSRHSPGLGLMVQVNPSALILHGSLSHKNHQLYKKSINLVGLETQKAIEIHLKIFLKE